MENSVFLIGRCGDKPDIHTFDNGDKIAKISLATSEKWKDRNGEKQERTQWHSVVFKGKISEVVEKWVKKGDLLLIKGSINYRKYEKENETKYFTEIICFSMSMLGGKSESKPKPEEQEKKEHPHSDPAELDRDFVPPPDESNIPF